MENDNHTISVDAKHIFALIESALSADYTTLRKIGNQIAKKLVEVGREDDARALRGMLRRKGVPLQTSGYSESLPRDQGSRLPLIETLDWPSTPSFLNSKSNEALTLFLEDARNIGLLKEKGVSARLGLLLYGPPGTGKTHLAGQIAAQLNRQLYVARLDSLISSRLGETSKNIRGIFEYMPRNDAILFLDEMDAIAKLRDDRHELGELKRVVNTVLQGLDSLTDDVLVIGATNHSHLLDPAIWRRFPYKLELGPPDFNVRAEMWAFFLQTDELADDPRQQVLAQVSEGLSGAEIELIAYAARRREVLDGSFPDTSSLLLAIDAVRGGGTVSIAPGPITAEKKREVVRILIEHGIHSGAEIGRALGVSRQMGHKYLKEYGDG